MLAGICGTLFLQDSRNGLESPEVRNDDGSQSEPTPKLERIQPKFAEAYTLPCGTIQLRSYVESVFPELEESPEYRDLSQSERKELLQNAFVVIGDSTGVWKIEETVQLHGPFHISTTILAAIARFFLASASELPKALQLPLTLNEPLIVTVYASASDLENSAPAWAERHGRNGYYDAQRNEIGLFVDAGLLAYLYPDSEIEIALQERLQGALDAIRRTVLVPLYHEVAHALQKTSGAPQFRSPFFAEGTAIYYASRLERAETLVPLLSMETLVSAEQHPERRNELWQNLGKSGRDIVQGRILLPTEYARLGRIRDQFGSPIVEFLTAALIASSSEFGDMENAELNYDLSWVTIQFLTQQDDKEALTEQLMRIALDLKSDDARDQLIGLEGRLREYLPKSANEQAAKMLAEAVTVSDAHKLRWETFRAYLAYKPVFEGSPNWSIAFAYIGDLLLSSGQRDQFFYYYDKALRREGERLERMSSRVRVVAHYINAIWKMGHYQQAADLISEYTFTTLDLNALGEVALRTELLHRLNEAHWEPAKSIRLMKEFDLGRGILGLHLMQTSKLVKTVTSKSDPSISDAERQRAKEHIDLGVSEMRKLLRAEMTALSYRKIPPDAWFVLEFQLRDEPIDVDGLGLNEE